MRSWQNSAAIKTKGPEAAKMAGAAASEAGAAFGAFSKRFKYQPKYPGGFAGTMSRREAFLILGLRCATASSNVACPLTLNCYLTLAREGSNRNKVREAHKKLMIANHPDAGGSPFVASKAHSHRTQRCLAVASRSLSDCRTGKIVNGSVHRRFVRQVNEAKDFILSGRTQ